MKEIKENKDGFLSDQTPSPESKNSEKRNYTIC